jgi:hypothetical protein
LEPALRKAYWLWFGFKLAVKGSKEQVAVEAKKDAVQSGEIKQSLKIHGRVEHPSGAAPPGTPHARATALLRREKLK